MSRQTIQGYRLRRRIGWKRRCASLGCKPLRGSDNIWVTYCRRCGRRFVPGPHRDRFIPLSDLLAYGRRNA